MTSMQDWKPMILNKSKPQPKSGVNSEHKIINKLDNETEAKKMELMPRNICQQLISGRTAKKLTQKQIAQQLNITAQTVQEIEQFKHKKDMQLAQRIARHLGIKLVK